MFNSHLMQSMELGGRGKQPTNQKKGTSTSIVTSPRDHFILFLINVEYAKALGAFHCGARKKQVIGFSLSELLFGGGLDGVFLLQKKKAEAKAGQRRGGERGQAALHPRPPPGLAPAPAPCPPRPPERTGAMRSAALRRCLAPALAAAPPPPLPPRRGLSAPLPRAGSAAAAAR